MAGAFVKDPQRRRRREGEPIENALLDAEPPAYLPKKVQEIWRQEHGRLVPGVALQSDHSAFERLCRMTYEDRRGQLDTAGRALLHRIAEGFGMTPSSRSRVKVWVQQPAERPRPGGEFFA